MRYTVIVAALLAASLPNAKADFIYEYTQISPTEGDAAFRYISVGGPVSTSIDTLLNLVDLESYSNLEERGGFAVKFHPGAASGLYVNVGGGNIGGITSSPNRFSTPGAYPAFGDHIAIKLVIQDTAVTPEPSTLIPMALLGLFLGRKRIAQELRKIS